MNEINPPAQVQTARRARELKGVIKSQVCLIYEGERNTLERVHEAGKLLNELFSICNGSEWTAAIEEIAIPHQRASEWRRIARLTRSEIAACHSIREAITYCQETGHNTEENADAGKKHPAESTNGPVWPLESRCRECRVSGRNDPNCKLCKEKNAPEEEAEAHEELKGRHPTGSRKPHEALGERFNVPEPPPVAPYKQRVAEAFQHVNDALVALEHYPTPPAGLDDLKKQTRALEQQYLCAFRQIQR